MSRHLESHLLPTYSDAVSQDHWKLIAPYIASSDLCHVSLACSRWHEIFAPHLWGDPASHFGTEDDSVYVALTRFRRVLPWARLYVRRMTHTISLPPAHAELYEGPHSEWLRDMMQRLPSLQCLIVQGLPFFDHGCLTALRTPLIIKAGSQQHQMATSLRLLNASHCANATYSGLAPALRQFLNLLWLDLSYTAAAKQPSVLQSLSSMTELQVLKLRGLALRDEDLHVLAKSLRMTVRSLDLSKNQLTDVSARSLLTYCFRKEVSQTRQRTASDVLDEPNRSIQQSYFGEALDSNLYERLTNGFAQDLVLQDHAAAGLTHLYISDNHFTVEGIASFLMTGRLRCLDAGIVAKTVMKTHDPLSANSSRDVITEVPGVEKLVNVMRQVIPSRLSYLRIGYEFATKEAPAAAAIQPAQPAEVWGDIPLLKPENAQELDGQPVIETEAQPVVREADSTPVFELEGDHAFAPQSPANVPSPLSHTNATNATPSPLRESVSAPEPSPVMSAVTDEPTKENQNMLRPPLEQTRRFSGFVQERVARAELHRAESKFFMPVMAPQLHTLILCNIPEKTNDHSISAKIVDIIKLCAREHSFARAEAQSNYACPPGTDRKTFERQYVQSIFPLDRIVLEMADPSLSIAKLKSTASWRLHATSKAGTEDPDSEAFWDAAQRDFTFFDDEECGLPLGQAPPVPSWFMNPIPTDNASPQPQRPTTSVQTGTSRPEPPSIDVVAEISKFRQQRKAVKQARSAAGFSEEAVDGYWEGKIQVTRPHEGASIGVTRDYYGNEYEKGFRYR